MGPQEQNATEQAEILQGLIDEGNVDGIALSVIDESVASGVIDAAVDAGDPLQPHSFNVLRHLCAGGSTLAQSHTRLRSLAAC